MAHLAFKEAACRCRKPYSFDCGVDSAGYCGLNKMSCLQKTKSYKIRHCS